MATSAPPPFIRLAQPTKVSYAEDVETHALSEVNLEIHAGEYVAVAGLSAARESNPAPERDSDGHCWTVVSVEALAADRTTVYSLSESS